MNIIKSVFSNTKIKIVCALCAALCVAACVQVILNHSFPDDVKITEAFAASDRVTVSECIVETTARLPFGEGSLYKSPSLGFSTILFPEFNYIQIRSSQHKCWPFLFFKNLTNIFIFACFYGAMVL